MHSFAWLIAEIPKFGPRNIAGFTFRFHVHLCGVTVAECGPRNIVGLIWRFLVHRRGVTIAECGPRNIVGLIWEIPGSSPRGVIGHCVETCTLSQASRPLPSNIHRPLPAYKQQAEHGNSLQCLEMFLKSVQYKCSSFQSHLSAA